MKDSIKVGFRFGITSAIITILGLMVGLNAGTKSRLVVLGGIFTIAIADALSDALGIHISEESDKKKTHKEVWEATISTVVAKFLVASTFIVPVILFPLTTAIIVSAVWGLSLLTYVSYKLAKERKTKPIISIMEHLMVAILVIVISYFVGLFVARVFG